MPAIADQVHRYASAMADPTRGMIVMELNRAGELTATQLAHRLGLNANNVYHHMRVLLQLGLVDPPRVVPGTTYVEKFYRITPAVQAALRLDPEWYERAYQSMDLEDRRAVIVSICLTMSYLLRQAARDYGNLDPDVLDRAMRDQGSMMLGVSMISREQLKTRLTDFRQMLEENDRQFAEDTSPRRDLMIIAGLPFLESDHNSSHG